MKKIMFSVFLIGAALAINAQEVKVYRMVSTGSNTAMAVPSHIKVRFETMNPNVTVINWEPVSTFWKAAYTTDDNRITHVYFNEAGDSYRVALPVIQGQVSEEVITNAIKLHGASLYSITRMKSANDTEIYKLRLLESGVSKDLWIDAQGTAVTDVYKVKVDDGEMKIKSEQ